MKCPFFLSVDKGLLPETLTITWVGPVLEETPVIDYAHIITHSPTHYKYMKHHSEVAPTSLEKG